ncbi:MAG: formylglycine-generating enzyme family protein [Methylococcaceae bacterium]
MIRDAKLRSITAITYSHSHAIPDIVWEKIPAGEFQMGSTDDDQDAYDHEKPSHHVKVNEFYISRYPITNAQYQCFIEAGGYDNESYWQHPKAALDWLKGQAADLSFLSEEGRNIWQDWLTKDTQRHVPRFWEDRNWANPNHPVVGVCWYEALAYCTWLNECLQHTIVPDQHRIDGNIRLPREEQWEYAARGQKGLKYAWGTQPDAKKGNSIETKLARTSTVGLFAPGIAFDDNIEIYDLSGNVWEWSQSLWGKSVDRPKFDYTQWDQQSLQRNDLESVELRIIRGGSWDYDRRYTRCATRFRFHPDDRDDVVGFRVVFSLAADD